MESVVNPDPSFWRHKRVFVTGHTGFKGSWLCVWLQQMGAVVRGYALAPPTSPSLFEQADVACAMDSVTGDVRDFQALFDIMSEFRPEVVFHLAAQPLVRESYRSPRETYNTNVMGTVHLLDAVRETDSVRSVVVVTTDKVYENKEWFWGYRENDRLGGYDPYSSSKAAAELVVSGYRSSFFNQHEYGVKHNVALGSVRAGNVIGAGDWAVDRLVLDLVRAHLSGSPAEIRNPLAIRPWQHVLEPLSGYLILAERLYDSPEYGEEWNFGPRDEDCITVEAVSRLISSAFRVDVVGSKPVDSLHEAGYLKLDISKAKARLQWAPRWSVDKAVGETVRGYEALSEEPSSQPLLGAIRTYVET